MKKQLGLLFLTKTKKITCPVKYEVYLTGVDEKATWVAFSFTLQ